MPVESLRLRFALLQSLNTTLETFFLPLVELRQTPMFAHSIAALLKEAKGQCLRPPLRPDPATARDDPSPLHVTYVCPQERRSQPRAVTSAML